MQFDTHINGHTMLKFQDQILLKLVLISMKNEIGNLICHHYSTFHVNYKLIGLTIYSGNMKLE